MHPPRCPYRGNASALRASRGVHNNNFGNANNILCFFILWFYQMWSRSHSVMPVALCQVSIILSARPLNVRNGLILWARTSFVRMTSSTFPVVGFIIPTKSRRFQNFLPHKSGSLDNMLSRYRRSNLSATYYLCSNNRHTYQYHLEKDYIIVKHKFRK